MPKTFYEAGIPHLLLATSSVYACKEVILHKMKGETLSPFMAGYFTDLAVPFGFYLGIRGAVKGIKTLDEKFPPYVAAFTTFAGCMFFENAQLLGMYGRFDIKDIACYALGTGAAMGLEHIANSYFQKPNKK
jgi:hypothetical protein